MSLRFRSEPHGLAVPDTSANASSAFLRLLACRRRCSHFTQSVGAPTMVLDVAQICPRRSDGREGVDEFRRPVPFLVCKRRPDLSLLGHYAPNPVDMVI